jgi:apolipoprotein N-acyltransferase
VLWIAFPILLWLLNGCRSWRTAALVGWAFGFGHFAVSFYWITSAFYVQADIFGIFAIPAIGALSAAFGLYIAVVCVIVQRLPAPTEDHMPDEWLNAALPRVVLFASAWTVIEWVRGWLFTGFPWNPVATVWSTPATLAMIQVTTLVGTYGLTLLTVMAAASPAVLGASLRLRRHWTLALAPLVVLAAIGAGGAIRLSKATDAFVPDVKLRLVQANISQADRFKPDLWEDQLRDYLTLSTADRPRDVTAVIWGEAAVPPLFYVNVAEQGRRVLASAAPTNGLLITGADRGVHEPTGDQIFNSMFVLSASGDIAAFYDKTHLVPFGEYMPLRWLIPFDKLTGGIGDFMSGTGLKTIDVPGLPPFTPLICYEAVFSGAVTPWRGPRPQWLLNLTNDAWFGMSWGPYQHFAAARLRAVEEGLPLVRVANTGISAVIDGYGRALTTLGLDQKGVLDVPLPKPAAAFTPFSIFRNLIPLVLATFGGGLALLLRRRLNP